MPGQSKDTHVLRELELPARYEALADRVGSEVAQLLVDPGDVTRSTLERAGLSVRGRREGALMPLVGGSGTGKTTLARNLSAFLPNEYAATVAYDGDVDFDSLIDAAKRGAPPRDDARVIPINIDHREATPRRRRNSPTSNVSSATRRSGAVASCSGPRPRANKRK